MEISNIDLTCVLCLNIIKEFNEKKTLSCEHMFHINCFNLYDKQICPICKKENYYIDLDTSFLNNINIYRNYDIYNNTFIPSYITIPSSYTILPPIITTIRTRNINRTNRRPPWRY